MKKILLAVLLCTGSAVYADDTVYTAADATTTVAAVTNTIVAITTTPIDTQAQAIWEANEISTTSTKYTFTAITAYDGINGQVLYGASTKIFRTENYGYLNYFSGDLALFTTDFTAGHGLPAVAITLHANDLISDKVPVVAKAIRSLPAGDTIFSKLTVSGWAARDFYEGVYRAGAFIGWQFKY